MSVSFLDLGEFMNDRFQLFEGPWFQLLYPASWQHEIIENVPCFFDPDGAGALQIAAYRNPNDDPFDAESEMQRYLEGHSVEFNLEKISRFNLMSGLDCLACEFVKQDRFWLVNIILRGSKMLLVIYNADEIPDDDTVDSIQLIVQSIRFI